MRPNMELAHLAWPFVRDAQTGKPPAVEQDTIAHTQSCEYAVAMTPVGFRPERPDFGWPWPELHDEVDPGPLIEALDRLVPTVGDRQASAYMDLADPSKWNVEVTDSASGAQ